MEVVPDVDQLKGAVPAGTPLEQLGAASALADRLRARGDELLDEFVDAARSSGSSWNDIGCTLGTSKQAAHERFAALADPPPGQAPFGLTGTAADVLSTAADQARVLGHHGDASSHAVRSQPSRDLWPPSAPPPEVRRDFCSHHALSVMRCQATVKDCRKASPKSRLTSNQ